MGPNHVLDKGFAAAAAISQFRAVKFSANDIVTPVTAAGELAVGICQETATAQDATDGRIVNIRVIGISRCIADAAITRGARVRVAADGRVTALAAATPNQNQLGIAWTAAAAANDHIDVLLTPGVSASVA